jgi:hypothetical protein
VYKAAQRANALELAVEPSQEALEHGAGAEDFRLRIRAAILELEMLPLQSQEKAWTSSFDNSKNRIPSPTQSLFRPATLSTGSAVAIANAEAGFAS